MSEEWSISPFAMRRDRNGVKIGPEGSAKIGEVTIDGCLYKNISTNTTEGRIRANHKDLGSVELYANKDRSDLTIGLAINPSNKLRKLIYGYSAAMGAITGVISYLTSSVPDTNYKLGLSLLTAAIISLGIVYAGRKLHLV